MLTPLVWLKIQPNSAVSGLEKKLEFQLALGTSSSEIVLVLGNS